MAISCRQPGDEAIIRHGCAPTPCARRAQLFVLGATVVGSSMAFIDGTVVNVALPAMQDDLHVTVIGLQWIVEAYALFLAALLLVGGLLGDRFGRRRMLAIGTGVFAVASL
ncbi:MAG: MFS transporter, partial [Minwuiales bacterium]|nr:MFS transporter [Minwuiales bacterium]